MNRKSNWLLEYKNNIFSQHGEDGVIDKILDKLPDKNKWCVEFGAWDGVYLSNTANLIKNSGYSAVLIEASENKFKDLVSNYSNNKKVIALNHFVGFTKKNNLDHVLETTKIPCDFDLLSIDIDGNDYHVWSAVCVYKPKLVVIEYNQTIPNEVEFVQIADENVSQGASLSALVNLAYSKGYKLVAALSCNAFFVRDEYFDLFEIQDNSIYNLRESLDDVTYIFSGYDGKIMMSGSKTMPWHGIKLSESKIQQLPSFLQSFPENYNFIQKIYLNIIIYSQMLFNTPLLTIKKTIRHFLNKL